MFQISLELGLIFRFFSLSFFLSLDLDDNLKPVLTENGTYSTELFARKSQEVIREHVKANKTKVCL